MTNPFIVEVFKRGSCIKRRKFTTSVAAVDFANNWFDEHGERYDVQVITPKGAIHIMGVNGNNTAKGIE